MSAMNAIFLRSPAKLNLFLKVINKRPDGFHNIETIMVPVEWTDILEIIPDEKL